MRQRVEDLGRLLVLIQQILDREIFEPSSRFKDHDYFLGIDNIDEEEFEIYAQRVTTLIDHIKFIEEELYKCLSICKGFDLLNESENGD